MAYNRNIQCEVITSQKLVTGSVFLYKLSYNCNEIYFLVDCGITQGEDIQEGEDGITLDNEIAEYMKDVKFAIITHPHADHIARLPVAVQEGLNCPIYMTNSTQMLLDTILDSNFKILQEDARKNNKKMAYTRESVDKTILLSKAQNFSKRVKIFETEDLSINMTLLLNAHIVGACCVFLEIHKKQKKFYDVHDLNIFITGDINVKNIFYSMKELPKSVLKKPITIICETTYGLTNTKSIVPKFETDILKAINEKKKIIVLVNALGKTQEVLLRLKRLEKINKLPQIWLDGKLAIEYCKKYSLLEEIPKNLHNFWPSNVRLVEDADIRKQIADSKQASIIITTSGMGVEGPAPEYIKANLSNSNALIYFTSYCAKNTFGAIIQEEYAKMVTDNDKPYREVEFKGMTIPFNCKVDSTREMSSHAKSDELLEFVSKFANIQLCILVHGEKEAKDAMKQSIESLDNVKKCVVLDNTNKIRFNSYGLEKDICVNISLNKERVNKILNEYQYQY